MTKALTNLRQGVTRADVVRALDDYDRLGPERFFAQHGFGPSRSYELVWKRRRYPHKAILGTAYELKTGHRLGSAEFERGQERRRRGTEKPGFHRPGQGVNVDRARRKAASDAG